MDPNAQQVINVCQASWAANQGDCSAFIKAVCAALVVPMSPGQADDIVQYFRDPANGWEALKDGVDAAGNVIRKEEVAKERADAGKLVLAGMTAAELGDANGHVAVVISAALIFSVQNNNYYPVGYWGQLGGVGGANQCLSYSFGQGVIDQVTYAAISF